MGNRANVIFTNGERFSPAIYLHWNGGPESVYAFLKELDRREVRSDGEYEAARFVQIVGEFFDSREKFESLSLGIVNIAEGLMTKENLALTLQLVKTDPSDNGFYVVNRSERSVDGHAEMRRFRWNYSSAAGFFNELPEIVVATERSRAFTDAYARQIEEFFESAEDPRNLMPDKQAVKV